MIEAPYPVSGVAINSLSYSAQKAARRITADELGIAPFVGAAVVLNPTTAKDIPSHPLLSNGGDSRIHNDLHNSAA